MLSEFFFFRSSQINCFQCILHDNLIFRYHLGNDYIHAVTSQGRYELRIDLRDFDNNHVFAKYQHFYVGDESSNYKLNVYGYSGAAGM